MTLRVIRQWRSAEVRARLIHGLADAWCEITGGAKPDIAIFIHEVPGANVLENVEILLEARQDPGAIYCGAPAGVTKRMRLLSGSTWTNSRPYGVS